MFFTACSRPDVQAMSRPLPALTHCSSPILPQEGKVPRTQVKLSGGDVLTVDSLAGVVQLNALRSFLADGFQTHLQVGIQLQ